MQFNQRKSPVSFFFFFFTFFMTITKGNVVDTVSHISFPLVSIVIQLFKIFCFCRRFTFSFTWNRREEVLNVVKFSSNSEDENNTDSMYCDAATSWSKCLLNPIWRAPLGPDCCKYCEKQRKKTLELTGATDLQ